MTTDDAAFSAFRQATESLTGLSESHQVRALEFELFRAIHRNHELQREMKTLEWKVIKLEGDGAATLDAFARHLHAELVRARDELAEARTAFARERGAMEEKVHAADKRSSARFFARSNGPRPYRRAARTRRRASEFPATSSPKGRWVRHDADLAREEGFERVQGVHGRARPALGATTTTAASSRASIPRCLGLFNTAAGTK